jgi:hypothetical protein
MYVCKQLEPYFPISNPRSHVEGAVGDWFDDGPIVCGGLIHSQHKHSDQAQLEAHS